jgi:hypothetical protein
MGAYYSGCFPDVDRPPLSRLCVVCGAPWAVKKASAGLPIHIDCMSRAAIVVPQPLHRMAANRYSAALIGHAQALRSILLRLLAPC